MTDGMEPYSESARERPRVDPRRRLDQLGKCGVAVNPMVIWRVHSYSMGAQGTFSICISRTPRACLKTNPDGRLDLPWSSLVIARKS